MKKIAIIGTAGIPARYGGFETLAHHLVNQLNNEFDITVYCSTKYYKKEERISSFNGARLVYIPFNSNGIQSIIYDMVSIIHALIYSDVLIILGVSGCVMLPIAKLLSNKKIIVNIDGLEWRRAKWSMLIQRFLKFSEWCAVRFSDADITDNEAIKRYTSINYGTLSYLVEYGGDQVRYVHPHHNSESKYPFLASDYYFKVARIEPENNIHVVLQAFAQMPNKALVVVGNWNSSEYGRTNRFRYSNYPNLYLLDPIYDQVELDILRSNCIAYIHGHSAGGTNPSLVEAMHLRLPIFAYKIGYNEATTENQAIYFRDAEDLIEMIGNSKTLKLSEVATKMKIIANRRYTWERIANGYRSIIYSFDNQYIKKSLNAEVSQLTKKKLQKLAVSHLHTPLAYYN